MARESKERKLQTRGVQWLKVNFGERKDLVIIAVINEMPRIITAETEEEKERVAKMYIIIGRLMLGMGLYPGAADLFLYRRGSTPGEMKVLALETKVDAPQSTKQEKFQSHWESIGGIYKIWRSLEELHDIIVAWGLEPLGKAPSFVPETKKQLMHSMYANAMAELWEKK